MASRLQVHVSRQLPLVAFGAPVPDLSATIEFKYVCTYVRIYEWSVFCEDGVSTSGVCIMP